MREENKAWIYPKEDFYKGMGAIVKTPNWHKLNAGDATMIALKATGGSAHEGDIHNAFIQLVDEYHGRQKT